MKKIFLLSAITMIIYSCGGAGSNETKQTSSTPDVGEKIQTPGGDPPASGVDEVCLGSFELPPLQEYIIIVMALNRNIFFIIDVYFYFAIIPQLSKTRHDENHIQE